MFGLIASLVTTLGATGMGSVLKIVAGAIDSKAQQKEIRERRDMLQSIGQARLTAEQFQAIFGADKEAQRDGRITRRIVAILGVLNFAALSILGLLWPAAELVTFTPPEQLRDFSLLWGLFSFPVGDETTVAITTGHLPIVAMPTLGAIFGFYFTPGGRK